MVGGAQAGALCFPPLETVCGPAQEAFFLVLLKEIGSVAGIAWLVLCSPFEAGLWRLGSVVGVAWLQSVLTL